MADVIQSGAQVISGDDPQANGSPDPGTTGKLADAGHVHQAEVAAQGVAVTADAALTSTGSQATVPAGGTGTAAGAYDTSGHRDTAITNINALIADHNALQADVAALRTVVNNLQASLHDAGVIA